MKRVLLIGLLFSASLTARELTLKEAVDIALKKNLELKAEKYKVSQKRYQYEAFKGYLFPQMSLSYFFMRTNQPPYSIMFRMNTHSLQFPRPSSLTVGGLAKAFLDMESYFNNPGSNQIYDLALRVEIPLWMGGKVRNALKGKFFEWKAQELISQRKEEEVAYSVADTFFKILYAKQALRATETALKDIKHHLKLVDRMHKAGLALYSDLLRVKVYYESVKAKNEEAKNNFFIAKKALALMLNQNWNPENLTLKGELQCPSPQKVEKDFKKLLKWFVDSRKDLVALKEGITAINFYKKATWGNYLPDFVAFGEYHLYDNNRFGNFVANSYMVGVGFQWKLFDGLNAFNKVRMLKEKERELETTLEYAQKGIKFELTRAVKEYQTAYAKYREALAKIEQAEESLKIVTARYKQGLARIVDLLDVQAQLDKARFERAKALYGCIKAYLKLYNTAGKMWEVLK